MPFNGGCIPARLTLAFLCATGVMEIYISRINLSIAIVAMVQTVTADTMENVAPRKPYCLRGENDEVILGNHSLSNITVDYGDIIRNNSLFSDGDSFERLPPIKMTSTQRGNVLSAFFYAYGLTGMLGGRLAERFGTKRVFGVAAFVDGIANFITPVVAKTSTELLICLRIILGLFQGMCYPSLSVVMVKWIPPDETSRFASFTYLANMIGTIITFTVSGIIISEIGWEWTFYIYGCVSFIWLIMWTLLMYDTPQEHPRISAEEKRYILESKEAMTSSNKPKTLPWKKMLCSRPVWAIAAASAGNLFGLSIYVTQLPIYMSSILGVSIRNNGMLSSLPFLARYLGANGISWLSIFLKKRFSLHPKTWKIIFSVIGLCGPAVSVIMVGYIGCSVTAALSFFMIGLGLNGAIISGFGVNNLDIAPNFAGTVAGFSSTIGFLVGMLAPVVIGALTPEETLDEWVTVYWIAAAIYFSAAVLYCIFLSTDVQPWNDGVEESKNTHTAKSNSKEIELNKCEESENNSKDLLDAKV